MLVKGTLTVLSMTTVGVAGGTNNRGKKLMSKNCATFTDCISEINSMQVHTDKDIDVVMLMCNLREYSNNYSKTSESLWQYYRNEPALVNVVIVDFPADNKSALLYSYAVINSLFVLSFENNAHRTSQKKYFLPTVEINDYNVMIDGQNVFNQPEKND